MTCANIQRFILIKINELSEKSRPSSHVVINSLFHLTIDSSPKQYPHERSGSFSSVHPHPRRIISGRSTYYGKSLLLPFHFPPSHPYFSTRLLTYIFLTPTLLQYLQDIVHQDRSYFVVMICAVVYIVAI